MSEEQCEKIEWITDRGANIKKALEDQDREDCTAHLINTIVQGTMTVIHLELRKMALDNSKTAMKLCAEVESVARRVKKVPDNAKVNFDVQKFRDLIEMPRTHLYSYAGMLQSVNSHQRKVSLPPFLIPAYAKSPSRRTSWSSVGRPRPCRMPSSRSSLAIRVVGVLDWPSGTSAVRPRPASCPRHPRPSCTPSSRSSGQRPAAPSACSTWCGARRVRVVPWRLSSLTK